MSTISAHACALFLAILALTGCSHFVKVEPNPANARKGFGYVDFHSDSETNAWMWQVYRIHWHTNIWGKPYTTESREDQHVWIAEIVAGSHRLVRVACKPGRHDFRVAGVARIRFGETIDEAPDIRVGVEVAEGMVTPVSVRFTTPGKPEWLVRSDLPETYGKYINAPGEGFGKPVERRISETHKHLAIAATVQSRIPYRKKEEMPYLGGK